MFVTPCLCLIFSVGILKFLVLRDVVVFDMFQSSGLRLWNLVSLVRVATAGSKMHGLSIPAVSSPREDFTSFGLARA